MKRTPVVIVAAALVATATTAATWADARPDDGSPPASVAATPTAEAPAVLVDGVASPYPTATPVVIATPPADPLAHAINFRSAFGMRSDREYVGQVEADPSARRDYGIAMTDAELADLEARHEGADLTMRVVAEALHAQPTFGGKFLDHTGGETVLVVNSSGDGSEFDSIIAKAEGTGTRIEVRRVRYPLAELDALKDHIASEFELLEAEGIELASIGADDVENIVVIGVVDLTDAEREFLKQRYGERVTAEPGQRVELLPAGPNDPPPPGTGEATPGASAP